MRKKEIQSIGCITNSYSIITTSIQPPSNLQIYIEGLCNPFENQLCAEEDIGKLVTAKNLYILKEYYQNGCKSGDLAIIELNENIGDHGAKLSTEKNSPISGDYMVSGFGKDRKIFILY